MGQRLSDGLRDLATLTMKVMAPIVDTVLIRVFMLRLCNMFEVRYGILGLPVRQILRIYCMSINRSGDLYLVDL